MTAEQYTITLLNTACVLALSDSAENALLMNSIIEINANPEIEVQGCRVQVNSRHTSQELVTDSNSHILGRRNLRCRRMSVRGQPDAAGVLKAEGHEAGRLQVSTLMKKMAIEALYRRPRTSKPGPEHRIYL